MPPARSASHAGLSWLMCRRQNGQYTPRSIVGRRGEAGRETKKPAAKAPGLAQPLLRFPQDREHTTDILEKTTPGRREHEAAADALEERGGVLALQACDVPADGRLRDTKHAGGGAQAARASNELERAEPGEVHEREDALQDATAMAARANSGSKIRSAITWQRFMRRCSWGP